MAIVGSFPEGWREKNFACARGLRYKSRMKPFARRHAPAGFTLVEMVITLALMAILAWMMYGFASGRHQRTQKQLCGDNLQKIYLAMQVYANDFHGTLPAQTNALTTEPVFNLLVPKYSADTTIFICPGGRDSQIPTGESLSKHKVSYAYYMGHRLTANQETPGFVLLSDRQVDTEPKRAGEVAFSTTGSSPGNNHHRFGGNFVFADGSVQSSGPQVTFSLAYPAGIMLLNPKP
jgi:prepilin-type N-terminal cleavage/methylation domain-containing protein/prepilin-type processing-associated H-X9-DG protein